jgi:hypothetical protein
MRTLTILYTRRYSWYTKSSVVDEEGMGGAHGLRESVPSGTVEEASLRGTSHQLVGKLSVAR